MSLEDLSHASKSKTNSYFQSVAILEGLLKLFNLTKLKQELEQPLSPITSLDDLSVQTDCTLKILERSFETVSASCSHWSLNTLFGSTVIASYAEKLIDHLLSHKFTPQNFGKTSNSEKTRTFTRSLIAEIAVSMSFNFLGLLTTINPWLTSLGIISTALGETLIHYGLNYVSIQSFSIFTGLIRQRVKEYSEFRAFVPEYRLYTNFFESHQYQPVYDLQILKSQDIFKVFKFIHTFSEVTDRRDLIHQLIRVLEKDEIFQERMKKNLYQLGGVFLNFGKVI